MSAILLWAAFTAEDWPAFYGAEPFEDGRDPELAELVLDGVGSVAVRDASGVHVVTGEGDDEWFCAGDVSDRLSPEMTTIGLRALGFELLLGGAS